MKIEIFGTGCPSCRKLEKNVRDSLSEENIEAEVIKVEDIEEIVARGFMITPGLAIDGKKVSSGKVLRPKEIKKLLHGQ